MRARSSENPSMLCNVAAIGIAALAALAPLAPTARASPVDVGGEPRSIAGWVAEWWPFMLSFPDASQPMTDATGERCAIGQRGPVWFLAPTLDGEATRSCVVPEGTRLLFPLVNAMGDGDDAGALAQQAASCIDTVPWMHAEIDGRPLPKLAGPMRVRTPGVLAVVPAGGLLSPGVHPTVVDDGYYVLLPPLGAGEHVLTFGGRTGDCALAAGYATEVTYRLTVRAIDPMRRRPTPPLLREHIR